MAYECTIQQKICLIQICSIFLICEVKLYILMFAFYILFTTFVLVMTSWWHQCV
jgi:hypothetical protein